MRISKARLAQIIREEISRYSQDGKKKKKDPVMHEDDADEPFTDVSDTAAAGYQHLAALPNVFKDPPARKK
jgi:hypothetical protein